MENNQSNNKQKLENKLGRQSKRVISLYQIDQGLKRAENYRLQQYLNQSERLRRQVQKVRDAAESRKEEMKQAKLKKQEMLNTTLSEAQLRRNQYLETARQNAREHFKKVRIVANTNHVSKRMLLWKQNAQFQTQLWNAEWRRSRALALKVRNACLSPGAKYYDSQNENFKNETNSYNIEEKNEAAALIQFFWRLSFIERVFSKLHLSWECCVEEGFDATKNKILDEEAQKAAASVVHLFYPRSRAMMGSELRRLSRLFLTSFVIAAHPQHVLEHPDRGLEQAVVDAARRLLGYLMDPQLSAVTSAVKARSIWTRYRVLYEEWERSDRERLIDGIMKDYIELETMKLKVDNNVSTKQAFNRQRRLSPNVAPWNGKEPQTIGAIWLPQIRKRQSRLRAALFRVGGHDALNHLQSNIQDIRESFEVRTIVDEPTQKVVHEDHLSIVSKDEYEYAQHGMNEIFAHEIMINVEEFIKELESSEQYNAILTLARRAFREKLYQAFCGNDQGEDSANEQLLRLIEEVRDKLFAILPPNICAATDDYRQRLEGHLDMKILRNQIDHYAFKADDAVYLLRLFTETLRSIEAVERDEELQSWEDSWFSEIANFDCSLQVHKRKLLSIVANRLCDILDRLDIIEKDIVISKIRILEPILRCHGPQWEDNRFQQKVFRGIFEKDLPQTSLWLTKAMKKLKQVYTTFDCMRLVQGEGDWTKRFLRASFIYLIDEKEEQFIVPEVLKLDERRLQKLRENLSKNIYITCLDLIVRRFVKQKNMEWDCEIEESWRDLVVYWKDRKWVILQSDLDKELIFFMEKILARHSTVIFSQQDKTFLSSLWKRVIYDSEPISSLLRRRISDFLYRNFLFHVSSFTYPRKQLQSLGFGYVVDDMIDILEVLKRTTDLMLAVHFHRLKPVVLRIAKVVVNESK
ncbi:hypothetical protein Gasu2_56610 [Galdieria sulphuraria]|nr:hypothetical protein Gasu2_56610 [Galdieria sulphuraria]